MNFLSLHLQSPHWLLLLNHLENKTKYLYGHLSQLDTFPFIYLFFIHISKELSTVYFPTSHSLLYHFQSDAPYPQSHTEIVLFLKKVILVVKSTDYFSSLSFSDFSGKSFLTDHFLLHSPLLASW